MGHQQITVFIRQLSKSESYQVWGKQGEWLNLGGNHWIYNKPSYI